MDKKSPLSEKLSIAKNNPLFAGWNVLMAFIRLFLLFRKTSLEDIETFTRTCEDSPGAIKQIESIIKETNTRSFHRPKRAS